MTLQLAASTALATAHQLVSLAKLLRGYLKKLDAEQGSSPADTLADHRAEPATVSAECDVTNRHPAVSTQIEGMECLFLGKHVLEGARNSVPRLDLGRVSLDIPNKTPSSEWINPNGGKNWLCVTPLSDTENHRLRGGTSGYPFGASFVMLNRVEKAHIGDAFAAVVVDLRSDQGDLWVSWRDAEHTYHTSLNGRPIRISAQAKIDFSQQRFLRDYDARPAPRPDLGKQLWYRPIGSSVLDIAAIAGGGNTVVSHQQRTQCTIAAAQMVVHGAGGIGTTHDGEELVDRFFHPFSPLDVVFSCGGQEFHDSVLELLTRLP